MIQPAPDRRALVSFCSAFLSKEMLHVYRQICAIREFDQVVVTRRRENADQFPFEPVITLRKSAWRGVHRALHRLRGRPVSLLESETRQLLQIVQQRRAAVVHIYLGTVAARAIAFLSRVPAARVVSFHGVDLSDELTQRDFHALLEHVDLLLVRSQSLRAELERRGCPPDRIRLNHTGIPLPPATDGRLPPEPQTRVKILQACRLIEKKGLDVSVAAVGRLVAAGRDVSLDIVGSGPEEARLRSLAAELGISDRVQFLGFVDNADLLRRLPQYHLFVHPSRTTPRGDREGIPNSMLEAMAFGVPIVATRHSGIPEAVRHEDNGLLVDRPCADAVAAAMARLLDDQTLYAHIARRGQETIRQEFSIPACVRALEQSYGEAIELAQASAARQPQRRAG